MMTPGDRFNDLDHNQRGSLSYYATLLEDTTTTISMGIINRDETGWSWIFEVATPESLTAVQARGVYLRNV